MDAALLFVVAWYLFLFGSIVWVGIDASKRDFTGSRFASKTWQWVAGMVILWVITFPVYLFKRRNAPLKAAV